MRPTVSRPLRFAVTGALLAIGSTTAPPAEGCAALQPDASELELATEAPPPSVNPGPASPRGR